ncbi:serine/threonine-protein kinase [Aureliella helgolandensis]|uniref:mitogen-activated protein kinase kinase n=1 Tax=Aureliella helgolandensis TaxID=2527968 RepID=A0A518GFG0_9BACT|nr:serine/threonine-protein kinase [Aureliella helgolandensis]QDV27290.1 Serine/threonine-protein kinase PknH [Aureliella helgolandensis]
MTKIRDFLGPYRLARLIRMGSTCQVWEGIETATGDRYALKVLREDFRTDKLELSQLKTEFEIAKAMNHPNVIRMHDLVLSSNTPFLVLELFSELNMKQALRRGTESIAFMLEKICQQSAEGLFHMHEKGFVHCDVKPDNFLVSREGEVKLIDFTISRKIPKGLGKLFGGKAKTVQGTRSYMSPEQIRNHVLDGRADIYSLGCVFFELATGKLPYTGDSPNDLLNKHLSAPIPSPLVTNDNLTPEFTAVIRSMMAKKPEDRPGSMWELLKTLRVTRIFKKQPRIPDKSIFDDFQSTGRVMPQQ